MPELSQQHVIIPTTCIFSNVHTILYLFNTHFRCANNRVIFCVDRYNFPPYQILWSDHSFRSILFSHFVILLTRKKIYSKQEVIFTSKLQAFQGRRNTRVLVTALQPRYGVRRGAGRARFRSGAHRGRCNTAALVFTVKIQCCLVKIQIHSFLTMNIYLLAVEDLRLAGRLEVDKCCVNTQMTRYDNLHDLTGPVITPSVQHWSLCNKY